MKIKVCASGDLMLLDKLPQKYYAGGTLVTDIINSCDVKITNLETVVSNWDCFASTFCGGQWINTSPDTLDDITKYGFNLYGCANNHAMDYSYGGLLSTISELEKRNIKYAGIGKSLSESSQAAILDLKEKGIKVALISVTSTFIDAARAGDSHGTIPARPGINPLRIHTKYLVSKEQFELLRQIASDTYINGERDNARKIGSLPPEEKDSINFGGMFFCVSNDGHLGKQTYCHEGDLNRIISEITKAKATTDYVFVSVHSHQIKKTSYTGPDYFLEEFSHKCIDAGADAIIGGGTHQLKPIEIYKQKPIFYSLGNFVFQADDFMRDLPYDFWDKYGYPTEWSMEECLRLKTKNGTVGLETDKANYVSVLPEMEFDDGVLKKLVLHPIELGFEKDLSLKGLPFLADESDSDMIFKQLCSISKQYNTTFTKNGTIEIILS